MLHNIHNYLFVQLYFSNTNALMNVGSRLQYENTKIKFRTNMTILILLNRCAAKDIEDFRSNSKLIPVFSFVRQVP